MNDNFPDNTLFTGLLVSCGAGVAAAAMFALAMRNAPQTANIGLFAPIWSFLAPAPIMVASLAFSLFIGCGSVFAGEAFLALLFGTPAAIAFFVFVALPSLTLCYVALRAPLPGPVSSVPSASSKTQPWLLDQAANYGGMAAAASAFAIVVGSLALDVYRLGSYDLVLNQTSAAIRVLLEDFWREPKLPEAISLDHFAHIMALILPTGAAVLFTLTFTSNLWFAGFVAWRSHRFPRPWPDLALDFRLGPLTAIACAACIAIAVFVDGFIGAIAAVGAGSLGAIFSLQGYAVVHALTRQTSARMAILGLLYLVTIFAPPWAMTFMLIGGWLESFVNMRSQSRA